MASHYLDSDVSARLAAVLRAHGHDAVTSHDRGLRRSTDDVQLLTAVREGRILLTHNLKDFVLLHDAWLRWPAAFSVHWPTHAGILVLEQRLDPELGGALLSALNAPRSRPLDNRLEWWRAGSGWSVRLDDGRWLRAS